MSGFQGGDTEQMRQHAEVCTTGTRRLLELITAASSAVDSVTWAGPDADSFRERWHVEAAGRTHEASATLERLARELSQHAEEQDAASAADGGGLFSGPLLPLPIPGLPLGPGTIGDLLDGLGDWFSGGGATGPQEFYGGPGYGGSGNIYGEDRPVGEQFTFQGDLLEGREIENEAGYVDVHAGADYSAGMNGSTDPYGNMTGTIGARGSLEAGIDERLNLPGGFGVDASARVGMEAYAEAGGTVGPDGFSAGARAGSSLYGEQSVALTHDSGASVGMSQSARVGVEAHADAHSHLTRNEDGQVNGFSQGFDVGAYAGGEVKQTFSGTAPGGWFSGSASLSEKVGAEAGASAGYVVSTDEVGVAVGGDLAAKIGLGGDLSVSVHPNQIVDTFTPGDYNLDDAIGDAKGAWDGATDLAGDAVSAINPFD
ncbi:hypothetical protein [Brachybacterium sp. YJGR34]|uniref:hypothetical protein n=1 Tax=Brachybacterium sp. YJGR34 TaxID=2059911 RepID=UPI000E0B8B16|nr:hypothetical protein [Brachybacterium sp. YJGR34]